MQPTLQPIAKIPLEATPNGSVFSPSLAFSPDGTVLYVRQPVALAGVWDHVRWYGPDAASVLMLAALVWVLVVVARTMRRRQHADSVYCRGCNYELTPPIADEVRSGRAEWLTEDAKCPECGQRAKKGPVVGRPRWWRVLPWVAGLGVVAAGWAGVLIATLIPLRPMQGPTWPVPGIETRWPAAAFQKNHGRFPVKHRVTRWDPRTGSRLGSLGVEPLGGMDNAALSRDGKVMALGCWQSLAGDGSQSVVLIDTATGARRELEWPPEHWRRPMVAGFTPDSSGVFVMSNLNLPSPGEALDVVVELVDVRTLERREVARVRTELTVQQNNALYPYFIPDERDSDRWVLVVLRTTLNGVEAEVLIKGERTTQDSVRRMHLSFPAAGSWYPPRRSGPGTVDIPLYTAGAPAGTRIDVALGTQAPLGAAPLARSADGAWEVRSAGTMCTLVDVNGGEAAVGTLTGGSGHVISENGGLVAATVSLPPTAAAPQGVTEVWVWGIPAK